MSILWLNGKSPYTAATKALILGLMRKQEISSTDIIFHTAHAKVPDLATYPKNGVPAMVTQRALRHQLKQDVEALRPRVIVVNDEGTLRALTNEPYTLAQVRGSVYDFEGVPVIILDTIANLYRMNAGKFIFGLDLAKIVRYAKGQQKKHPKFHLKIAKTLADVKQFAEECRGSVYISEDTETANGVITVQSFTYDCAGFLRTFCVPYLDPFCDGGAYWRSLEEEVAVREVLAEVQGRDTPKAMSNGMYDCAYFVEDMQPPENYILDTQYMMHSVWIEAPKALHMVASYFLDNYKYWKDESEDFKEAGWGKTRETVERYWRYNGLDTYNTWLCTWELLQRVNKLPWAIANYNNNISLAVGPCLAASLRGLNINKKRHGFIMAKKRSEAQAGLEAVRRLTCEPDFNPRSPDDCAWFIYDFCGVRPTRIQKGKRPKYNLRSCDEKVLKLVKEQNNFIADEFIDRLFEAKKPAGVVSKYGNLSKMLRNDRFLSWLNPTATKTFRFNSGKCQFWTGTNAQNIPMPVREFFTADPNYVLVDIDYSASDDRFVAYECEDPAKMETVEGKRDTHCVHCSVFFSLPYEDIEKGWKADDGWVVDEPKGVRQITKKITHGRNYKEGAQTMYNLMGRDAVVATAIALGHPKAGTWNDKELIGICQILIDKYDHPSKGLYKRIRPWGDEIVQQCKNNQGLMTNAFGLTRKFFGDPEENHKVSRELAAQYGQSNTAGNINRTLRRVFYGGIDDGYRCLFLLQVHDSLLFAVHRDHLSLIGDIVSIMEEKVTIHGREMRVPASPKVGLTWAKKMLPWTPEVTYKDVVAFEEKVFGAKYNAANELELDKDTISQLENMLLGTSLGPDTLDDGGGEQMDVFVDEDGDLSDDGEFEDEDEDELEDA